MAAAPGEKHEFQEDLKHTSRTPGLESMSATPLTAALFAVRPAPGPKPRPHVPRAPTSSPKPPADCALRGGAQPPLGSADYSVSKDELSWLVRDEPGEMEETALSYKDMRKKRKRAKKEKKERKRRAREEEALAAAREKQRKAASTFGFVKRS